MEQRDNTALFSQTQQYCIESELTILRIMWRLLTLLN